MAEHSSDNFSPNQLRWCHANRQARTRTKSIGALAAKASSEMGQTASHEVAVFEAISAVVDDEFRRYCRYGGMSAGSVVILVNPADARYHSVIRTKWHLLLREHLERVCRGTLIRRIRFELGTDGATFQTTIPD
ncbi:MAG TPA: hypothetical protein PKN33_01010 [Phycisphaerae bacterium]|nr:hypothetical protein [Phycisphaerae bacterium]